MDVEIIENLFEKLFDKLLKPLLEKFDNLPTKEYLDKNLHEISKQHEAELQARDHEILELKARISELELRLPQNNESSGSIVPISYCEEILPFTESSNAKEKKDVIIIGDSIIRHLDTDKINPGKQNTLECLPGAKIGHVRNKLVQINDKYDCQSLILHFGSNNIPDDTPEVVYRKILATVEDTRKAMPNTKIFVSAILPKLGNKFNKGINYVNQKLFDISIRKGFYYIHNHNFCANGIIDRKLYSKDNIHLSYSGVARLGTNIKYMLKICM